MMLVDIFNILIWLSIIGDVWLKRQFTIYKAGRWMLKTFERSNGRYVIISKRGDKDLNIDYNYNKVDLAQDINAAYQAIMNDLDSKDALSEWIKIMNSKNKVG